MPADIKAEFSRSIEETVAVELKRYWKVFAGNEPAPDKPDEYRRMAHELIDGKKFKTPGGKEVDLGSLKRQLDEMVNKGSTQVPAEAQSFFTKLQALDEIPERGHVNVMAGAVEKGVQSGSGILASIGNYIGGFFTWVFSGCKHGFDGLKECIGRCFANSTGKAVQGELIALRSDPALAKILTPERIERITSEVAEGAMKEATGKTLTERNHGKPAPEQEKPPAARETLDSVKPMDGANLQWTPEQVKQKVTTRLQADIETAFKTPAETGENKGKTPEQIMKEKSFSDTDMGGVRGAIGKAMGNTLNFHYNDDGTRAAPGAGKSFYQLGDEQRKAAVKGELTREIGEYGGVGNYFGGARWTWASKATTSLVDGLMPTMTTERLSQLGTAAKLSRTGVSLEVFKSLTPEDKKNLATFASAGVTGGSPTNGPGGRGANVPAAPAATAQGKS